MRSRRGGVYLACLDPVVGHEIAKTRPVLVVSNDVNNEYSPTVTVLPITSSRTEKAYPFEVLVDAGTAGLMKRSKIKADQIRTLDARRLVRHFGDLEEEMMKVVDQAMSIHLGIGE
jgi:mRNA interferase MazF